ncbi:hypothetical protein [Martelella endophytica]|uniref:Uncharacterized protein n=1 Tax=Martelella endophytica TaxID=1486262 RepID=A0A0D5LT61_MAREN|nr:hypothetical protein [Martelella endophytica]AJY47286.1 hypothetical protein TM49_19005 [Martelella endophytica]
MEKELPPKKARQGRRSPRAFVILAISIALALVAWAAVELFYNVAMEPEGADQNADAPAVERPSSPSEDRALPPANE